MRSVLVVPLCEVGQLATNIILAVRDQKLPGALTLNRAHQSFDYCDAAVLADRSEPLPDHLPFAPCLEASVCELFALVGNEVFWNGPGRFQGPAQERPNLRRSRLLLVDGGTHQAS